MNSLAAMHIERLKARFGASIIAVSTERNEAAIVVNKESLLDVCRYLKSDAEIKMNFLADVIGVDYYPARPRFEVIYILLSISKKHRVRLKVRLNEEERCPSVTSIWKAANWYEREAYDMFGIIFEGHSGLRRIYMPDDWEGFPLRRDYPLRGYKDKYNPSGEEKK